MSMGQQAVILFRLDAHTPDVVPVADLATYMGLPADMVRKRIRELADMGHAVPLHDVQTALIIGASAGGPLPGVQGEGAACA